MLFTSIGELAFLLRVSLDRFCRLPVASCSSVVLPWCSFRHVSPVLCCAAFSGMLQLWVIVSASHANGASLHALVGAFFICKLQSFCCVHRGLS